MQAPACTMRKSLSVVVLLHVSTNKEGHEDEDEDEDEDENEHEDEGKVKEGEEELEAESSQIDSSMHCKGESKIVLYGTCEEQVKAC